MTQIVVHRPLLSKLIKKMSILASAGRAKIYNTDGTGRDTYVSFNSGGFAAMKSTAPATKSGAFTNAHLRVSA